MSGKSRQHDDPVREIMDIINGVAADLVYSQIHESKRVGCYVEAREKLAHAILAVDALLLVHGKGMSQQGFSWGGGHERKNNTKQAAS